MKTKKSDDDNSSGGAPGVERDVRERDHLLITNTTNKQSKTTKYKRQEIKKHKIKARQNKTTK